jgi:hypothetical protein
MNDEFLYPNYTKKILKFPVFNIRHIDRHAVQQEIDMSTCPRSEVFCLLVTQDINKWMWRYEDKVSFIKWNISNLDLKGF